MKLTITDGVFFKEIDDKQDPSELVKGLVTLGQEAIKAASSAAKAASDETSGKAVGVHEFVFDETGTLTRMKELDL